MPQGEELDDVKDKLASEISHLREVFALRVNHIESGIALQATEYERRLKELNEARAEARQKFEDYVDVKIFEELVKKVDSQGASIISFSTLPSDIRALFAWKEEASKSLSKVDNVASDVKSLTLWRAGVIGIAAGAGAVCGVIGGFVTHWLVK